LAALGAIARSRTEPASSAGASTELLAYRDEVILLGAWGCTIKPFSTEAKAWVVNRACRKAKELGYPHELWTTRLLARHAREQGPAEGHSCLAKLAQGTLCNILNGQEIKPDKVRY
jgi:hypothetical protein